ncbi:hypothetical protein OG455_37675 [Kitasatospora sp. NBC_01287]|uniref:hypothetical protein n=1 Tax=Kitasatospora sp. NBC_01287 TaxID=2903573 RepID=UPI00225650D3|nr:hypothetical protein [Kitasatospora sp. NBC_01287]MCX4751172.1 hypothetical protein [Kitasatospora sp. NBC_01287]
MRATVALEPEVTPSAKGPSAAASKTRLEGELETDLLPWGKEIRFSLHSAAEGEGTSEESLVMAMTAS